MKTPITLKSRLPQRVVYKLCSYLRGSLQETQDISLRKGLLKLTEAKERLHFQSDKNQYFYKIKRRQRHIDGQQAQEKMLHRNTNEKHNEVSPHMRQNGLH